METLPTPVRTLRIASTPFVDAPGLWHMFEHARKTEPTPWTHAFLHALTADRLTVWQAVAVVKGHYRTELDGDTLVLHVLSEGAPS